MSKESGGVTAPVEEKILTPRILITGVILSVLLSLVSMTVAVFLIPGSLLKLGDLVGPFNTGIHSLVLSFAIVSLAGVLLSKTQMDPRRYAVVFSMILVSTMFAGGCFPIVILGTVGQFKVSSSIPINFGPYVPWWIPTRDVSIGMTIGGLPVPWAQWTTPLLILWTGVVVYFVLWVSLFNIFRRQWVDVEKMDFVWANVYTTTILNVAPRQTDRSNLKFYVLRKRFIVAIILGAVFQLQMALNIMYPWFPAVTSAYLKWPFVSWHPGTLDFGVAIGPAWFEGLPGWTGIIFSHPIAFAVSFLMPLEILLTAGIFTFIQGSLIPMILSFMGMVPKPAIPGGGSRYGLNAWWYGTALGPGNPYLGNIVADWGFWVGLGFFPLIVGGNWRYIVDTLRAVKKGPTSEEKEREPMSYRWAWMLFAACIVLFLVWGYVGFGLGLAAGILWLAYYTFSQLGFVRMKAAGFVNRELGDDWIGPAFYYRMTYPPFMRLPSTFDALNAMYPDPDAVSWNAIRTLFAFKGFLWANTDLLGAQTFMETYKIGANLGIKPRDMFRSIIIATLVVISTSMPLGLWYYYTFGIKPEGLAYEWGLGGSAAGSWSIPGFAWVGTPDTVGWKVGTGFLISFLAMGALVWLRSSFIWFPLSPVGAAMGVQPIATWIGWGYNYLITYFLKRLAFRVGGIRLYEDWITPVAIGFIVGYGLGTLLWGVASIVRFLYI